MDAKNKRSFSFWHARERSKKGLHGEKGWGMSSLAWKILRRRVSSQGLGSSSSLEFDSRILRREKNKREDCLLSIFLPSPHLLQMSFFNLQKGSIDLKEGSRSAYKMIFVRASTLEESIRSRLRVLSIEDGYTVCCQQLVKTSLPYLSAATIIDPYSGIKF